MTVKSPSWRSVVANLRRMDAARSRYLKKILPKIKSTVQQADDFDDGRNYLDDEDDSERPEI